MSADKLLPLPEKRNLANPYALSSTVYGYTADQLTAYALANMAALCAELIEAREGWHMANGVAELAMQHRDAAERESAAICTENERLRADMRGAIESLEEAESGHALKNLRAALAPHAGEVK